MILEDNELTDLQKFNEVLNHWAYEITRTGTYPIFEAVERVA